MPTQMNKKDARPRLLAKCLAGAEFVLMVAALALAYGIFTQAFTHLRASGTLDAVEVRDTFASGT